MALWHYGILNPESTSRAEGLTSFLLLAVVSCVLCPDKLLCPVSCDLHPSTDLSRVQIHHLVLLVVSEVESKHGESNFFDLKVNRTFVYAWSLGVAASEIIEGYD